MRIKTPFYKVFFCYFMHSPLQKVKNHIRKFITFCIGGAASRGKAFPEQKNTI